MANFTAREGERVGLTMTKIINRMEDSEYNSKTKNHTRGENDQKDFDYYNS